MSGQRMTEEARDQIFNELEWACDNGAQICKAIFAASAAGDAKAWEPARRDAVSALTSILEELVFPEIKALASRLVEHPND